MGHRTPLLRALIVPLLSIVVSIVLSEIFDLGFLFLVIQLSFDHFLVFLQFEITLSGSDALSGGNF